MNAFWVTCEIVLPTFFLIALGYLLRLLGVIDAIGSQRLNQLCFKLLIPAMVFYNIYQSPLGNITNWRLMGFAAGSITTLFLLLLWLVPRIEKDNTRRGVMVQGMFRSSFVVLGVGLVSAMYGSESIGVTAMLSAVVAPLFNAYAVIALEVWSKEKTDLRRILHGIVTNPLIVASALAIGMLLLGLRLPAVLVSTIGSVSATATPLALMVLGSAFRFSEMGGHFRQLGITCLGRLVLVPLVFMPLAVALGFRKVELLVLLVLFASPNAVSSHIMATNAGGDDQLAGQVVVFSTCFSVITLFAFIYTLITMGYL